jgi:hypothetical protein
MLVWGSPLGAQVTFRPTISTPDYWQIWSNRWNADWHGNPKSSEKAYTRATSSTINPTQRDLRLNPDSRDGKPATNRPTIASPTPTPCTLVCAWFLEYITLHRRFLRHMAIIMVSSDSNMHDRLQSNFFSQILSKSVQSDRAYSMSKQTSKIKGNFNVTFSPLNL